MGKYTYLIWMPSLEVCYDWLSPAPEKHVKVQYVLCIASCRAYEKGRPQIISEQTDVGSSGLRMGNQLFRVPDVKKSALFMVLDPIPEKQPKDQSTVYP